MYQFLVLFITSKFFTARCEDNFRIISLSEMNTNDQSNFCHTFAPLSDLICLETLLHLRCYKSATTCQYIPSGNVRSASLCSCTKDEMDSARKSNSLRPQPSRRSSSMWQCFTCSLTMRPSDKTMCSTRKLVPPRSSARNCPSSANHNY